MTKITFFGIIGLERKKCDKIRRQTLTKKEESALKSTGIVRKIDDLGRIVLPIELRRTLEVSERDPLEIFIEDNTIILKKYQPACIFCGNAKDVVTYKGRNICPACIEEISKKLGDE